MNLDIKHGEFNNHNFWNWKGFKICWSVKGENNTYPIIFLHGFGASSKHWRNNLDYFAKKDFATYSLDLIGFGYSDQPGLREIGKLDNEIWSNQVKDFINQVIKPKNSKKIILIGNSLGALVALTCATFFENEIATVIASPLPDQIHETKIKRLVNPIFRKLINKCIELFFIILPLELIIFLINKLGFIQIGLKSAYYKKGNIDKDLIDMVKKPVSRKTAARSLRAMCIGMSTRENKFKATYLLKELSKKKKVPFLLIWGNKDKFIPLFLGKKIAKLHRWVKLKIISNSGHCIHDEDPTLFNKISYEWIKDLKTF